MDFDNENNENEANDEVDDDANGEANDEANDNSRDNDINDVIRDPKVMLCEIIEIIHQRIPEVKTVTDLRRPKLQSYILHEFAVKVIQRLDINIYGFNRLIGANAKRDIDWYVGDDALDYFAALMLMQCTKKDKQVCILTAQYAVKCRRYDANVANWAAEFRKNYVLDFSAAPELADMIIINFHRQQHWTLVVIDTKKKKITVYDSEPDTDLEFHHTVTNHLIYYLFEEREWNFEVDRSYQQPTPVHCGVFNMLIMKKILCNSKLEIPLTEDKILEARYKMALEILEEKIDL